MLSIQDKFPKFNVQAVVSREPGSEFTTVTDQDLEGKWSVVFFWPLDFTFVCPTEIAAFNKSLSDFEDRDAQVFGLLALGSEEAERFYPEMGTLYVTRLGELLSAAVQRQLG